MPKNPLYVDVLAFLSSGSSDPANNGEIRYVSGTGFRMNVAGTVYTIPTSTGSATAYDDIGNPDANKTIAFAGFTNDWTFTGTGNYFGITANSVTTGNVVSVTADGVTSGSLLYLDTLAAGLTTGKYIQCYDGAADDFTVGANGATVIAGSASGTDALTLTAGDITVTAGEINVASDNAKITLGASEATDAYIKFDGAGNLTFYDSTNAQELTLAQLFSGLPSNPTLVGNVTLSDGKLNWTDAADEVAGTWTFAGTTNNDITWASSVTTGTCLSITADNITTGSMLYLDNTAAGFSGSYIKCYDGAADDFTVGANGLTTIAGAAAATDALVLTLGTLQMTDGNIDMDQGKLEIDTTTDETTYVKRNLTGATAAVVEIEATHTGDTGSALLIDHKGTGNAKALEITHAGVLAAIDIVASAARTGNVINIPMANQLAQTALDISGAATGTNGEGIVHVDVTGALAGDAIRVDSTGTNAATSALFKGISTGAQAGATNGIVAHFQDTGATAATSYAVYIDSTNNEALKVDAGAVVFDESLTIGTTLGVTGATTMTGGLAGTLIHTGTGITATSGPDAVAVTGAVHEVTTTGAGDALTLANGTAGQRLCVIYVAETAGADTAVITPTTLAGGATITLNALGDSVDLVYSATGGWHVLGLGGSAAVA